MVDEFGAEFKEVLEKVRKDLGSAIETMSERSSATMKEGSEKLNSATKEISNALGELSKDVKDTMNKVESSIGTALELQKRASIEFTNSTQTLNENIETTTQMMEQLGKDITSGMSSVAEAGQRMGGIGKNLDSIGKRLESQVPVLESLFKREEFNVVPQVIQKINGIEALLISLTSSLNNARESTLMLNESVETTIQMMEQRGKDITNGINSVAEAGQRMEKIGEYLESGVPIQEDYSKPESLNIISGL